MTTAHRAMAVYCVGRFCLEVPAGFQRMAGCEVEGVRLEEVTRPGVEESAWNLVWEKEMARIVELKNRRSFSRDASGTVLDEIDLMPGLRAIVYNPAGPPSTIAIKSLLRAGQRGMWLYITGGLSFKKPMIEYTLKVAQAYRARGEGERWPIANGDWSYMENAAIALPPQTSEVVELALQSENGSVRIDIEMKVVAEPDRSGLLERMAKAVVNAGANFVAGFSTIKQGRRTVAGLRGEEMVLRDSKSNSVNFGWVYPGEPKSGSQPRINIHMETRDSKLDEKSAIWNGTLDSIRPTVPR